MPQFGELQLFLGVGDVVNCFHRVKLAGLIRTFLLAQLDGFEAGTSGD